MILNIRAWRFNERGPGPFRIRPWQIWLALALAAGLGLALAIVAAGLFLLALPIVAIIVLAYRVFGATARSRRTGAGPVIEGEYEVIEADRRRPAQAHSPWSRDRD